METVEPGIYRRANGKLVVPIYDPATGKKRYSHPDHPRGGFPNTREGLKAARAFKRRMEREKAEAPPTAVTCDEYAKRWPDTHPRGDRTNFDNRYALRPFVRDFAGVPMQHVTRPLARLWVAGGPVPRELERQAKTWSDVERRDGQLWAKDHRWCYKVVRAMWNDARNDFGWTGSPFNALRVEGYKGRRGATMLSTGQLNRLVATAGEVWGDFGRSMVGPMIDFAAATGMRPGELYALRWPWVDWEAGEVTARKMLQARTGKEKTPKRGGANPDNPVRTIALLPRAEAALRTLREMRRTDDDHVFYVQSGKRMSQRTHWYYWAPVRKRFWERLEPGEREEIDAGFDFYELRHWFGSTLAAAGVSAFDIADQMGNSPEECMRTYVHTRSEDARDRVRRAVAEAARQAS